MIGWRLLLPLVMLLPGGVVLAGGIPPLPDPVEMLGWRDSVTVEGQRYPVPEQWRGFRLGLSSQPEPADLVDVPPELCAPGRKPRLRLAALLAFRAMAAVALSEDVQLLINSGYRSVATQRRLFATRIAAGRQFEEIAWGVAPPGYSEHMLGTTVDLALGGDHETNPAYLWLRENGESFGFVETYPRETAGVFPWEPWHWRYLTTREMALRERGNGEVDE
jgi:hypothetical protein